MNILEKKFEKVIKELEPKQQIFVRKIKNNGFKIYNNLLKPILWAYFMFYIFNKIKNLIGIQEATFTVLVVILIFLRMISSNIQKLVG